MRINDWSSDVCSSDLSLSIRARCMAMVRRAWAAMVINMDSHPHETRNAEFLLVFRLRAPSMRCHASGELFLGGLWAGIAVRRLVRPATPTDRKRVVWGKSVSVRVCLGGGRSIK